VGAAHSGDPAGDDPGAARGDDRAAARGGDPAGDDPAAARGDDRAAALAAEKSALRRRLLAARAKLTEEERAAAGRALRDAVLALPQTQMAGTVASYFSIGSEPGTHGLVYALWKRGSYVLLPLLRPDMDLDWASYEGPDSLRPGPRGLAEPAAAARGPGAVASADLVIIPALAVARNGVRLGRGGGSYDRALARMGTQVPTIALIYDGELLDYVPAGPHDQRVRLAARPSHEIASLPLS
jgi:5-formyltetrahydrofolate cyclo-ligase